MCLEGQWNGLQPPYNPQSVYCYDYLLAVMIYDSFFSLRHYVKQFACMVVACISIHVFEFNLYKTT
jgi:hypothetical protein